MSDDTEDPAVAVKEAEVEPTGTVTDEGTDTRPLLLDSATLKPPLGAAPVKPTVHVDELGGVNDEGLQVRLLTETGGGGGGCEIETVPLLPEAGMGSPLAATADRLDRDTTEEDAEVPLEIVRVKTATTPFPMAVVLNPVAKQVWVPDPAEHETDLPAAEAAEPVEALIAEKTEVS